jgi:hypothetical protein
MTLPNNFNSLDEFETWLHHEVCQNASLSAQEFVGVFNPDGTFVDIFTITQNECSGTLIEVLTPEQDRLLRGKIVTHNHPSESTFSYLEVLTCFDLDYCEFRVLTPFFTYILKKKNGQWPSRQDIVDWINTHIPQHEFEQCIQDPLKRDRLYIQLANEGFFQYKKEPRY